MNKATTIYLTPELHRKIKMIANIEDRTFSEQVVFALERFLEDPRYQNFLSRLDEFDKKRK